MTFHTWGNSIWNSKEVMRLTSRGRLGINTTTPTELLDVNGNIKCSGTIRNSYYQFSNDSDYCRLYSGGTSNYFKFAASDLWAQNTLTAYGNGYIGGRLGVGISAGFQLHVGNITVNQLLTNTWIYADSNFILNVLAGSYYRPICAKFENDIWVNGYLQYSSDKKIKKNIQDIDDDIALQKILQIEPKTYNYIDILEKGPNTVYGFIAQQIKEIIPEAVTVNSGFIPNIYNSFDCNNNIINITNSNLNINDEIEVLDNTGTKNIFKINDVSPTNITIDKNINGDRCFVIGSKVDDFHALNKEYIFTLNVCATQDLYKLIQQQNQIIQDLQNRINILENNNI